jgi:hypothetical protein
MPGASSAGERSGAVVIPQCVGASPGPTDSEMPGASSALNHSASAFAVPCSPAARFCQSNERGGILHEIQATDKCPAARLASLRNLAVARPREPGPLKGRFPGLTLCGGGNPARYEVDWCPTAS